MLLPYTKGAWAWLAHFAAGSLVLFVLSPASQDKPAGQSASLVFPKVEKIRRRSSKVEESGQVKRSPRGRK
ncbi:hypothetical protein F4809DRAFT_609105 [Biscogniauxia mediterranea]|nr:hypothetical protein F4809DRAFT_609105 [Biscogniauxia mediterranea]